ncbi:solute carrier family 22 member 17 isoform X6 [Tursiops truncatus]|uniref:Solute carrier family 22 member 17 isoform X6 n=2 Tax=Odontoceti TaxID=9722 RepID=A0A6J3QYG0_TURTR|nr:solute carrier family 22 member 17 isoform X6 [Tursiops truncatus]
MAIATSAQLARALYDNTAESPQELSFRRGDVLRVLQREGAGGLDGWCLCSLHGQQGIVPANRVKLLPNGPAPKPGLSQVPPAQPGSPHPAPEHGTEDQEVRAGAPQNPKPGHARPPVPARGGGRALRRQLCTDSAVYVVPPPARPCPTSGPLAAPCPPSPDPIYKVPRGSGTQQAAPGDALEVYDVPPTALRVPSNGPYDSPASFSRPLAWVVPQSPGEDEAPYDVPLAPKPQSDLEPDLDWEGGREPGPPLYAAPSNLKRASALLNLYEAPEELLADGESGGTDEGIYDVPLLGPETPPSPEPLAASASNDLDALALLLARSPPPAHRPRLPSAESLSRRPLPALPVPEAPSPSPAPSPAPGRKGSIQDRPLPPPPPRLPGYGGPKVEGDPEIGEVEDHQEGHHNEYEGIPMAEEYDYVHLKGMDKAQGARPRDKASPGDPELLERGPPEQQEAPSPGEPLVLPAGDLQLLHFYAGQCQGHYSTLQAAVAALMSSTRANQPPRLFVPHGKQKEFQEISLELESQVSVQVSMYLYVCRPRERRQSPILSLRWALAPLPLSDEESGPKVLLTWEGEESLEEGEGKAAQRSQRRRRRPRLQSRVSPASVSGHRARHWARGQCILSVRAARAPEVGKLAPRVATGTPEPNGGGGSKIDSTVEITPSPNGQVGTLGDAVPTEQLQGERERERERDGEGDAGGDGMGSSLSLAVPPGPLSFEALLAQVGALGGGQQLQLGLCCLPVLFVALGMASDPIFTLAPPLHCHYGAFAPNASGWEQPPNASGVSVASAALAASAASRIATSTDPSCSGFAPPDFNHCLKDWDYNGLPVLTTNAIGQWDLVCDLGWQVILEQILFILGFASGYLFLGYPADRFGRRGIVLLTLGLVGPCGVGGAAAGSSTGVMALRFLLGFLLAGVDLGVYLMRLELCDPTQRLRVALAGELVGVGGHFLFLGLALVSKDWRFLQRMITAPCILFLFYGWPGLFLESARWLIVKRQIEEAQSVLRILAERNRPHGQMLGEEAQEALQDLNEAAITTFSVLGLFSSQAAGILSTLLAAEVIPTTVRGRGLGLIMALGALGGLSGPAQRLHMGHGAFLQHVVLAACALLCILSIMLLPETKRKLLPEVLRDGELCRRPSLLRQPPPNRCDHVPLLATPNPAL